MKFRLFKKSFFSFILFLFISFFYLYKVGEIPAGLFCDEAQIGNTALQLSKGNISLHFIPLFFYKHFHYVLGYLPILSTAPFVFLLGLSEFSVRLASVFYSLIGIFFVYLSLNQLGVRKLYPLLFFAFTPLFFHISRINFGHTPSFLFMSIGIFFKIRYQKTRSLIYIILSSLSFGISIYGYGGYLAGTPVLIVSFLISEIFRYKHNLQKLKGVIILCLVFLVLYLPILYQLRFNSEFSQRLRDKNDGNTLDLRQKIPALIKNYPKYYSYDYLFSQGEIELPGSFITRNSIRGNGIYLKTYLAILIVGFFNLFLIKDKQKHYFNSFFIFFLLSPLPDLLTTKSGTPPYSFALFYSLISVPFITAYALKALDYLKHQKKRVFLLKTLLAFTLVLEIFSFLNNYYDSPLYSSDYWGWQYGSQEIVKYFITQKNNYAELYMSSYFNEPFSLLNFYDSGKQCGNCYIGGIEKVNPNKKQLLALRTEEINRLKKLNFNNYLIKKIIYYPDNTEAFYLIEPLKSEE